MHRIFSKISNKSFKMANVPARRKSRRYPIEKLLEMGYPRKRALKALTATGNNGVQLAADWLLAHANDPHIDECLPRAYTVVAHPTGALLLRLSEFWQKSQSTCGWNSAHNSPPHITIVEFFRVPDEFSFHIGTALRQARLNAGEAPSVPMNLDTYTSPNFMGLFVSQEYNKFFQSLGHQFIKNTSRLLQTSLDERLRSAHMVLALHFDESAYEHLRALVENLDVNVESGWEARLYSADSRFSKHKVYKVIQDYTPKGGDELELVVGDLIYIEEKQFDNPTDGWVCGTSWLTGVSGRLLAANTVRTADSDAWTLHEVVSLGDIVTCKKMSTNSHPPEVEELAREKSEESFKDWDNYWSTVQLTGADGYVRVIHGSSMDWQHGDNGEIGNNTGKGNCSTTNGDDEKGRWIFTMRHGERVDLTYGHDWTQHCFDTHGNFLRKDLNLPLKLGKRAGGRDSYSRDSPMTRVGRLQASLVGEALRLARVPVTHVYASAALRCVETAHHMLEGLGADPSIKIKVEPGLFEYKLWHLAKGMAPFMTPLELHLAGYNVDLNYKPYVDLDIVNPETLDEYFERNEKVMLKAIKDTEAEGGNIIFVAHADTLNTMALTLSRWQRGATGPANYQVGRNVLRVPYCALAAARRRASCAPRLAPPPCPPCINSSSGRFDWKILLDP